MRQVVEFTSILFLRRSSYWTIFPSELEKERRVRRKPGKEAMTSKASSNNSSPVYLYCLLAVFVLCSVTLTWDTPLLQPYHQHYVSHATYHGVDVFTEDLKSPTGPEHFMEHFYICYGKDGRKTYYKKLDPVQFSNRRYWVISASGKFVASMMTC